MKRISHNAATIGFVNGTASLVNVRVDRAAWPIGKSKPAVDSRYSPS